MSRHACASRLRFYFVGLALIAKSLLSAAAAATAPTLGLLRSVEQTPVFDPRTPDRFGCPEKIQVNRGAQSIELQYTTEGGGNFLSIESTNGRRECAKINVNGGLFATGRECTRSQARSIDACERSAAGQELPDMAFVQEKCRNDFPLNCHRTDYKWTVEVRATQMTVIFDCVNCARTLKQGVCRYDLQQATP